VAFHSFFIAETEFLFCCSNSCLAFAWAVPTKNKIGIPEMSAHCIVCIESAIMPSGPVAAETMILQEDLSDVFPEQEQSFRIYNS
jgi:hypothetical protein